MSLAIQGAARGWGNAIDPVPFRTTNAGHALRRSGPSERNFRKKWTEPTRNSRERIRCLKMKSKCQYQQYKMNQNAIYFSCETVFAGSLARVNGMTTAGGKFIQTRREGSRSKPGMRNFRQARSE